MAEAAVSKRALRAQMRARRRALSPAQQRQHSLRLASYVAGLAQFRRAKRVAMYWACDGEIDLGPMMRLAWRRRKQVFLPRVTSRQTMEFAELRPGKKTARNRYGIPEPGPTARKAEPGELDLVLAPLVAFSRDGGRLGMGGGFYDRALPQMKGTVIGVAHSCQGLEHLPLDPWDIPMQMVITEKGAIRPPFQCARSRELLL